jgi:putative endonuclease
MLRILQRLLSTNESDGDRGERLAAEWLTREKHFRIVARNWRNPADRRDEIDLVAQDEEALVFVEVKARRAGALVPGFHAVDERKKRALRRAIQAYLGGLAEKPATFRFDVVEVSFAAPENAAAGGATTKRSATAATNEILHFENVPLFSKYFRG